MPTNNDLLKKNPVYTVTLDTMASYEMAYLGGYVFKRNVRKKRPSEDSAMYTDMIQNTVAQPICRYIVDTINDVLFEPGVKRNIRFCTPDGTPIDPEMTEWADLFLLDADLNNRTIDGFMETVGDLTSIFGHCWVFVDMPKMMEGNLGRPYVCAVSPIHVWDWEWTYIAGKPMLEYIKVMESQDEEEYKIKCYHLGNNTSPSYWRQYNLPKRVNATNEMDAEAELVDEGTFPLGMALPGFVAYGRRDPRVIDLGVSDIDSATDAMREHYKLECEAYGSIQFAKTIIRADKGITIPVHAGAIARGPAGSIEAISVDTNDVQKIIDKQRTILEDVEAMVGIGGLRNSKTQVQSGISIIEERRTLHRVAKGKARLMEVTEAQLWTFAARFMEMRWGGTVNYNTDYEAHDTNYRMALMSKARELAPTNVMLDVMIGRELVSMLAPQDEAAEYMDAYTATVVDPTMKQLLIHEEEETETNDLGSQIPVERDVEPLEPNDDLESEGESTALGGAGTPVTPTGPSYYTKDAIAVMLNNFNSGR